MRDALRRLTSTKKLSDSSNNNSDESSFVLELKAEIDNKTTDSIAALQKFETVNEKYFERIRILLAAKYAYEMLDSKRQEQKILTEYRSEELKDFEIVADKCIACINHMQSVMFPRPDKLAEALAKSRTKAYTAGRMEAIRDIHKYIRISVEVFDKLRIIIKTEYDELTPSIQHFYQYFEITEKMISDYVTQKQLPDLIDITKMIDERFVEAYYEIVNSTDELNTANLKFNDTPSEHIEGKLPAEAVEAYNDIIAEEIESVEDYDFDLAD